MRELQFLNAIRDLEHTKIGLFLSTQQYVEGNLVAVQQDHLALAINEDVHYIPLQHIKALSKDATDHREPAISIPFVDRQSFSELLDVFKNSWCTINHAEQDAHVGVLSKVAEDHLVLINHAQLLYIPTSCISTIHSNIPQREIRLANQHKNETIQETQPTPAALVKMETQPPIIQEVHRQLELVPQLLEFLLAKELPATEVNSELQTVENESGLHEVVQQLKTAESQDLLNEIEMELQKVEEITEAPSIVVEESPDDHDESLFVDVQELPVLENVAMQAEPLAVSLHTENTQESLLEDEEDSSEFDDFGDIESLFSTRSVKMEMLSFSDPLGYERDFPLSSWATFQKEKQRTSSQNEESKEIASVARNNQVLPLSETLKAIDYLPTPLVEQPSMKESETDGLLVEESQPTPPTNASFTIIKMSLQDEKAMLEEQYFSLAKHAAKISQRTGRKQSMDNSPADNVTVDGQFISLMNHAAKMYQQLLDK